MQVEVSVKDKRKQKDGIRIFKENEQEEGRTEEMIAKER